MFSSVRIRVSDPEQRARLIESLDALKVQYLLLGEWFSFNIFPRRIGEEVISPSRLAARICKVKQVAYDNEDVDFLSPDDWGGAVLKNQGERVNA